MSLAREAVEAFHLRSRSSTPVAAGAALPRLSVYGACVLLCVLTNYLIGKDLPWDTLNYHFYAGFSAVNDRFAQDYFAAGPPSYFNPYAYAPFYALVESGLSPLAISSVLAVFHSTILWLTFELAVCVCPSPQRRMRLAYGVCAIAVTFCNPIFIQQIGSSYADISTTGLVLAAWLLLAFAIRAPQAARVAWAGVLLGAATALKLTNSVHAIAGCALLLFLPQSIHARIRHTAVYGLSLALSFTLVSAPWSYRLERMFGNPLFPLMNGVFRSPEFTTEPLRHFRFIPENLAAALWRPFALVDPVPMVQEELTAPDVRYAALMILAAILVVRWLRKPAESSIALRTLAALGCGLTVDWVLWLSASGNGRYFIPMAGVAAVVLVALVFELFATRPKARNYVMIAILGTQMLQLYCGTNYRWAPEPWDRQWLGVDLPQKLATEPNLYMTVGVQSNSFIGGFLPRESGLINFSGGYALGSEGASGARISGLISKYSPHLRVLWRGSTLPTGHEARRSPADDALLRFGLRIDPSDCSTIVVHGLPPDPEITIISSQQDAPLAEPRDKSYLATCRVVADDAGRTAERERTRAVDRVLDRLEDACPMLFQPRRLLTEHTRDVWRRLYVNTDLVAMVSRGTVKFLNPVHGGPQMDLGLESDWAKAPQRIECGRRGGRYFAHLSPDPKPAAARASQP